MNVSSLIRFSKIIKARRVGKLGARPKFSLHLLNPAPGPRTWPRSTPSLSQRGLLSRTAPFLPSRSISPFFPGAAHVRSPAPFPFDQPVFLIFLLPGLRGKEPMLLPFSVFLDPGRPKQLGPIRTPPFSSLCSTPTPCYVRNGMPPWASPTTVPFADGDNAWRRDSSSLHNYGTTAGLPRFKDGKEVRPRSPAWLHSRDGGGLHWLRSDSTTVFQDAAPELFWRRRRVLTASWKLLLDVARSRLTMAATSSGSLPSAMAQTRACTT